jgi:type IV pilus assembly protein PilC
VGGYGMPLFKYIALNSEGQNIQGTYNAKDRNEILYMLREKQCYPVMIKDITGGKDVKNLAVFSRVRVKDLSVFCRQFNTMLNSGITIIKCLDILMQQTENRKLREVIAQVYEDVQKGSALSEAMKKHRNVFPEVLVNMVEAGELSGTLDQVMERMAIHFEKENRIVTKVKSALIYPIILTIVAVAVVIFLLIVVMPTFISMFESSGVAMPLPTRILLSISNAIRSYWYAILLASTGIAYFTGRYLKSEKGSYNFDRFKLNMPVVKGTVRKIATSRFTRTLSTLLASGIPLMNAMDVAAKVVGNKVVAEGIEKAREEIRKGIAMSEPIKKMGVFPPMVDSMIKIGEESGALDEMLAKTANFYDEEVEARS